MADWESEQLHHWLRVASKHGVAQPCELDRSVVKLGEEALREFVRTALGLNGVTSRVVVDPWGNEIVIDERAVDKALLKPSRAPYAAWMEFGIRYAVEVWEHMPEDREDLRRYYLAPMAADDGKEPLSTLVIVGTDGTAFNVFKMECSYANGERFGTLVHRSYDAGEMCVPHTCCNDIVEMHRQVRKLVGNVSERDAKIQYLRKARKNGSKA